MQKFEFTIPENLDKTRLDKALAILCENISRTQIQKAIKNHNLTLNGVIISDLKAIVKENDHLKLNIPNPEPQELIPQDIKLDIIYEDDDLIVVNKPVGMTVHPSPGNMTDTLVNALLFHTKNLSDVKDATIRPGIVHRLDKNTSGLMIVAKNNYAHIELAEQIKMRSLMRKYKALIWGVLNPSSGAIDINIARSRKDHTKMTTVATGGKTAITHYQTLEIFYNGLFSLLECKLETGRTHQIRVHLSKSRHSIVGDQVYGNNLRKIKGLQNDKLKSALTNFRHQALHSYYLSFTHPVSKKLLEFNKEPPDDYNQLLSTLKSQESN
ncbi:MAG: RluA family pseudouridine synthase [Rickettsiaceae bacterium]|nr:RluA family pseudouridine synthase [Rickettsiaceae bacterium]